MSLSATALSCRLRVLLGTYLLASLAHFVHNAEYIAFYPNMPAWIARETVYLAWIVITSLGLAGLVMLRLGWHSLGLLFIGAYGAFGLDGLAHYTLALCSEHTLATNITIWSEAVSGLILLLTCATLLGKRFAAWRGRV